MRNTCREPLVGMSMGDRYRRGHEGGKEHACDLLHIQSCECDETRRRHDESQINLETAGCVKH
jgi:hypothetical protein